MICKLLKKAFQLLSALLADRLYRAMSDREGLISTALKHNEIILGERLSLVVRL
jgi:hypothetical protein